MASYILSTAPVASSARASMAAPFTGLKSSSTALPITRKPADITSLASNGGRVQCMKVWPPTGNEKFETLSYLPPLRDDQLLKQIDYLLRKNWIPCIEFDTHDGSVFRENHRSPGYYDGRYWTMWKLPMFGCTDSSQVVKELKEAIKAYPGAYIRIIGFDNYSQVQCLSFLAYKPSPTKPL